MSEFGKTIESVEKQKLNENKETIVGHEKSVEEVGEQMIKQSENEIANFQIESETEFSRLESRAEKDGFVIDSEDKLALGEINAQSNAAKEEFISMVAPPPLPVEYLEKYTGNMPPPLPMEGEKIQTKVCTNCGKENGVGNKFCSDCGNKFEQAEKESEPNYEAVENCLKKSKIKNEEDALGRLMQYAGVSSKKELAHKLNEKDENGDNVIEIDFFTPDELSHFSEPSVKLLKRIKGVGDALGYTFMNTPTYESDLDGLLDKLKRNGKKEEASEIEEMFQDLKVDFESEKDDSGFEKIDDRLFDLLRNKEEFIKYVEEIKNLPPDAAVDLYHGLNNGGYDGALDILNGSSKGIEQHSGPTLSLVPIGQFWKGVGFRYKLRRDQIEFPGENNPNAVVQMRRGDDGIEDTGYIVSEEGSLPLDQFEAEVMRSKFTLPDPKLEKKLADKLDDLSKIRNEKNNLE